MDSREGHGKYGWIVKKKKKKKETSAYYLPSLYILDAVWFESLLQLLYAKLFQKSVFWK